MKVCKICKMKKQLQCFYKNIGAKDGYKNTCRKCQQKIDNKKKYNNTLEKKFQKIPKHIKIYNIRNYEKLNNICGVYTFINKNGDVIYIGGSCNIKNRIYKHIRRLENSDKECNKKLLKAWNNKEIINIGLLEECETPLEAEQKEQFYISKWPKILTNRINHYKIILSNKDIKRFWSYVNKGKKNECWEWKGCINKYGIMRINNLNYTVHRISYKIKNSNINLKGCIIRHRCNNKICVNPNHLEIGSTQDNRNDILKGVRV